VSPRALVVVGASAGGVEALRSFVAGLPVDLDAAVCVVLHIPRNATSALPRILSHAGDLTAVQAVDGEHLAPGRIYVAPANVHLLVSDGKIRLSRGPTENGHRPAIDPLFRSAARAWGHNVIGVVLSGTRDDGAAGLVTVAAQGGGVLVQDPAEALYASMPRAAADQVSSARVMPVAAMGDVIEELIDRMPEPEPIAALPEPIWEAEDAMADMSDLTTDEIGATPAGFGCPTCHGGLFELPGRPASRFRCRIGHAWSAQSLVDEQSEAFEGALWTALRSLEEKAAMSRRLADSATGRGNAVTAARYDEVCAESEQAGKVIRHLIVRMNVVVDEPSTSGRAGR
jgi:two-component system chemotaxis response regulator CheB